MNATFLLNEKTLEDTFNKMWIEAGCIGLKRSSFCWRLQASMYNALPLSSVQVLVEIMQELEKKA